MKSSNNRFVKIGDFGHIAIHHFTNKSHTNDRGTIRYMAPEVKSNKNYNTKADIYSLGNNFKTLFYFETIEWSLLN